MTRTTHDISPPLRLGVIGLGVWGPKHAVTAHGLRETELVAVVDRDTTRHDALPSVLDDVARFASLDDALAAVDADAWIIASSTSTHVPFAKRILETGKAVLVEKPLASTLDEAETLGSLIREDSSNLLLGHSYVYGSEFLALEAEVKQRGKPVYIDCVRHRPRALRPRFPDEIPFHMLMVHDLYLTLSLMDRDEPSSFSAQVRRTPDGKHDVALAQLGWPDGRLASFTASMITPEGMPGDGYDRMEVYGEGWAVRIDPNPRPIEVYDDRARWPLELEIVADADAPTGLLAEQMRRFVRVVRGEASVPVGVGYHDALTVQRWLDRFASLIDVD
jgi:predicted dehydrogenase